MFCDAGVSIHTVQHMTLYLQINTEQPMLQTHYQTVQCPLPPLHVGHVNCNNMASARGRFDLCVYLVVSHQT